MSTIDGRNYTTGPLVEANRVLTQNTILGGTGVLPQQKMAGSKMLFHGAIMIHKINNGLILEISGGPQQSKTIYAENLKELGDSLLAHLVALQLEDKL